MQVSLGEVTEEYLRDAGFEWRFSVQGKGQLLAALSIGVIFQLSLDYSGSNLHIYFEKTLKEIHLAQHWKYWNDHKSTIDWNNIAPDTLADFNALLLQWTLNELENKDSKELKEEVELVGDVKVHRISLLQEICEQHKLLIVFLKQGSEGHFVEIVKGDRERSAVLPVVLEVCEDSISFLYHSQLSKAPTQLGFPYLMLATDSLDTVFTKSFILQTEPQEYSQNDTYRLAKYNVTATLTNFVCEVLPEGVPLKFQQQHAELKEVIEQFQVLHSVAPEKLAYSEDLKEVAHLSERAHSITNCSVFPPTELVALPCSHSFHIHCLLQHLKREWTRVRSTQKPVLCCPMHAVPVPDKIIAELDPALIEALRQARLAFKAAYQRK